MDCDLLRTQVHWIQPSLRELLPLLDAVPGLLSGAAPHLLVAGVASVVTCNMDC